MHDPYAVLGIDPTATPDQIRAAYRARSMLLHPDLHEGRPDRVRLEAERAMAQLSEAYEALTGGDDAARERPRAEDPSPLYRLGRLVARTGLSGVGQADSLAFRLGRMVGRRGQGPDGGCDGTRR